MARLPSRASVSDAAYSEALAKTLKDLVCSGDRDAIYVVRGDSVFSPGAESRLQSPGAAAISLIDDLTDKASKDCPVAAALTDADRAKLLEIKQGIEKAGKS
jgi:hypothetical protein